MHSSIDPDLCLIFQTENASAISKAETKLTLYDTSSFFCNDYKESSVALLNLKAPYPDFHFFQIDPSSISPFRIQTAVETFNLSPGLSLNLEHQLMSYLLAHDAITPIKAVKKRTVTVKIVQRKEPRHRIFSPEE
jgi:hypothetical protein